MYDAALGREIGLFAARGVVRKGDGNLQVGADGDVETCDEGRSAPAQIFAGSLFLEGDTATVATAHREGQAYGDPTLRALFRLRGADLGHALGPRFWRHVAGKNVPRFRALRPGFAPHAPFDEVRRRSPRHA